MYKQLEDFIEFITYWSFWSGYYLEVVVDFTTSKYFDREHITELIDYAVTMAQEGHNVFFGPGFREKDLGSQRSNIENLYGAKCFWVDIDSPDKSLSAEERLAKSGELLDNFKDTLKLYDLEPSFVICSGHGYHVYLGSKPILMDLDEWAKIQITLIQAANGDMQAKDPTRLMRLPCTFNYKDRANPKPVTVVEYNSHRHYLPDKFDELVRDYGYKRSSETATPSKAEPVGFTPPCIDHLLNPGTAVPKGARNATRLVIATFGFHEGWPVDDVIEKVQHFTDDPKISERDIRRVYKVLGNDPDRYKVGCGSGSRLEALVKAGITICDKENCGFGKPKSSPAKQEKTEEEEVFYTASFNGLVDLVLDDQGKIAFLVKENGNLLLQYERKENEKKFVPPPPESITWLLPRASAVLEHYTKDTDVQLFESLINFHKGISEMPDNNHYKFIAAYDMHTYLIEKSEYSPVIWFFAIPERGKTRTGKAIIYVSYRGIHFITVREAHIIRIAQNIKGTLFLDVSDLWSKVERESAEDILLNRYENGATVPRVKDAGLGPFKDMVNYQVYGATIAATNEVVNDVMASRAVQIVMPQSSRSFEDEVKPQDGLPFRERLVAFRARWIDKDLPEVEKPCRGRLGDILRPIRKIVNMVGTDETWFHQFVKGVEDRRKQSGAESFDAQVIAAMSEITGKLRHGHMLNEDILFELNKNKTERERISPQKLGRITAALGFKKYTSGQQRGIYWDEPLFLKLCERYGIEYLDGIFS